jgi:mannose/fructose/N-acetylgalactosamine-specific phosphotransferase system component IIC
MSKDLSDNIVELNGAVKDYIQTKLELVKLTVLKKITKFAFYLISFQIIILLIFLFITYLTTAFAVWYAQNYQNMLTGLLLASGILVVIGILFFVFFKKLITKNLLSNLSEILFEEDER